MSKAEVKKKVLLAFEESFNKGNLQVMDEIFSKDMVDHSIAATSGQAGLSGLKKRIIDHRTGLPDLLFTIDTMVFEGDKLAFHWTLSGTQSGPWMGRHPTGNPLKMTGMNMERLNGEWIVEHWSFPDIVGAMVQIGFVPGTGHAGI
jgi:predicted ester cyclase